MLDDDARRALEEEAIALVSLSHSHPPKKTRRAPTASREGATVASTNKRSMDDRFVPASRSNSSGVFATNNTNHHQQQQVHVMARPRVRISDGDQRTSVRETENDPRFLSMSVFVNADGEVNELVPGTNQISPQNTTTGLEIRSLGLDSKHHTTMVTAGFTRPPESSSSPTSTANDPQISMQSLLVTLKKRKSGELHGESTQAVATNGPPTKLPRFRDVFEPPRSNLHVPADNSTSTPLTRIAPLHAAAPPQSPSPPLERESQLPAPPELKCKYRTGKCTNTRALKSCGDYHNLCNYHRLRANANQRKLDRKKKVQRVPSSSESGSPSSATVAPAVAAAAALASLPSSFVLPSSTSEDPRQAGQYLPYFVPGGSSSSSTTSSS